MRIKGRDCAPELLVNRESLIGNHVSRNRESAFVPHRQPLQDGHD